MDKSTPVSGSLAQYLAEEMNNQGRSILVINISTAGDTLRRITDVMQGEFAWWLRQFHYDGILFSAGGNDFIDAARDPDPGQGILRNMAGQPLPADGYDCVNQLAMTTLLNRYLNPNFNTIYQAVRNTTLNASTPIFLNCYDTPVARNAPALRGVGPWLYTAYRKNHIAPTLWPSLTAGLFRVIQETISNWCNGRTGLFAVPTTGILTPANPESKGSSGDWANEIHPNRSGWRKQSRVWSKELPFRLA
ncbi:MAG: hypothetical protein JSS01_09865 [Proteobacteria bacterium]|nr:hypothetical protein [Pseudomonadota bacterium]